MRIIKRPRLRLELKSFQLLRNSILRRDGWRCQSCGSRVGLEVHHITPRSKLGPVLKRISLPSVGHATAKSTQNDACERFSVSNSGSTNRPDIDAISSSPAENIEHRLGALED